LSCRSTSVAAQQRAPRGAAMPVIAFIADPASANGKALQELLPDVGEGTTCLVGNDVETFKAYSQLAEVEVIVPVVFAGGNPAILTSLWPCCPKVRWVHSMAAGVDTLVKVLNTLDRGLETPLTNAKGAFSRSLAEYAVAAMLHFNKQVPRLQDNRKRKQWDRFIMGELYGQTVGFIGFGDIGQTTARLCKAFGMRIVAFRNTRGSSGDELADQMFYASDGVDAAKAEVFKQSDYVICSLPGAENTFRACGQAEFAAMKPSGMFISMGRGSCVDEAALVDALKTEKLVGAALDVFDTEPLPAESPLWDCENVLLSPHNADLTSTYMRLTWDVFLEKLQAFTSPGFSGFKEVVDKDKGY